MLEHLPTAAVRLAHTLRELMRFRRFTHNLISFRKRTVPKGGRCLGNYSVSNIRPRVNHTFGLDAEDAIAFSAMRQIQVEFSRLHAMAISFLIIKLTPYSN
jgi:hypothetical protein